MSDFTDSRGAAFALPLVMGVLVFILIPAAMALGLSFCQWPLSSPAQWVGLDNYAKILGTGHRGPDPLFLQALCNTLVIALMVPAQVAGSFLLARFLNQRDPWRRLLRLIVFLPTLVSPVALYITWRWILNADFGFLAQVLGLIGLSSPAWLEDPAWSKPAVMMVILWETVGGFQMLVFLAGFRQIPEQLFEMAYLDGLNPWQKISAIYWPWLKRLVLFNLCLGFLGAMQGGFEIAYLMTGGGPLRSTTTLSFFLFENAFQWQRLGYASAIGMVMFLLVLPLLLLTKAMRGRE